MPTHRKARTFAGLGAAAAIGVAAAIALAAPSSQTVKTARNAALNASIAVDSHGRTLYRLSPETTRHLLCRSAACLSIWRPLSVASRHSKLKLARSISGHLSVFRRPGSRNYQVSLRGWPLYTFAGDSAPGQANGQGIKSFGGTWLTIVAATGSPAPVQTQPALTMPATTTPMTTTSTPTTTTPSYGY